MVGSSATTTSAPSISIGTGTSSTCAALISSSTTGTSVVAPSAPPPEIVAPAAAATSSNPQEISAAANNSNTSTLLNTAAPPPFAAPTSIAASVAASPTPQQQPPSGTAIPPLACPATSTTATTSTTASTPHNDNSNGASGGCTAGAGSNGKGAPAAPRAVDLSDLSPPPAISPLPARRAAGFPPPLPGVVLDLNVSEQSNIANQYYTRDVFLALRFSNPWSSGVRVFTAKAQASRALNGNRLTCSESSWMAQQMKQKWDTHTEDDVQIVRKVKAILNKISDQTFDKLSEDIINTGIYKPQSVEALMTEVFDKVTTQHHFIDLYTRLCVRLCEHFSSDETKAKLEEMGVPANKSFRHALLNCAQTYFEENLRPEEGILGAKVKDEAACERELKYKTKLIGNVKFIAKLLIHRLLAVKLFIPITQELRREGSVIALECLAVLLSISGEFLETFAQYRAYLDDLFENCLRANMTDKANPNRLRCLLMDVVDKRRNKWRN
ncbi:unnamed protein product [Amoebophrya sp. A25]|nr:unnamed protein product [Amoebophrya sp. A25]|eukprot:GSA25T00009551001.1